MQGQHEALCDTSCVCRARRARRSGARGRPPAATTVVATPGGTRRGAGAVSLMIRRSWSDIDSGQGEEGGRRHVRRAVYQGRIDG